MSKNVSRATIAALGGVVAVLGPLALDRVATTRARDAWERQLGGGLGARVRVQAVRLEGAFTVELRGLSVRWPGPGVGRLQAPRLQLSISPLSALRLAPRLDRLELTAARFHWVRPEALARLRQMLRRLDRRRGTPGAADGTARSGRRAVLELDIAEVTLADPGRVAGRAPRLRRLELRDAHLVRRADGKLRGRLGRGSARLTSGQAVSLRRVRWRGRQREGGGVRTYRVRVGRGRITGRHHGWQGFRLVADEVAPDLLQVQLVSEGARPRAGARVQMNLDGVKRSLQGRLQVTGLPLGELQPWLRGAGLALGKARGGLTAKLSYTPQSGWRTQGQLALGGLVVHHPSLASRPVRWPALRLAGILRLDPARRRISVKDLSLRLRSLSVQVDGWVAAVEGGLRGEGNLSLPSTHCQRALGALPQRLVSKLHGLRLSGAIGGRLALKVDSRALDELHLQVSVAPSACRVMSDAPRADVQALRRPFAFVTRPPGWSPTRLVMGPQREDWVPYSRLGRNVIGAFLAAEDRRFFEHRGFDLENIRRALAEDLRQGELAKGASSISQQVVKNVFLSHRRTLARKLQEVVLTWRLEQVLDKRRILEIYLNLVEMGPGLFGVRAAARHYFGKEPHQLDPLQAVHLAAITPNPRHYFQRFRSGRAGMDWLLHLRWLLYQMHAMGWLGRKSYEKHRVRDLRLISRPRSGNTQAGHTRRGEAQRGNARRAAWSRGTPSKAPSSTIAGRRPE